MDLKQLVASLEQHRHAPTEQWNPPFCGDIPMRIDTNGDWYYQDSPLRRVELVKLFASVLVIEDNDYFLVTPAEKVRIQVADAPFLVTSWREVSPESTGQTPIVQVTTNVGDTATISNEHSLFIRDHMPYIQLWRGLTAKLHRNVYYQWAYAALEQNSPCFAEIDDELYVLSHDVRYCFAARD